MEEHQSVTSLRTRALLALAVVLILLLAACAESVGKRDDPGEVAAAPAPPGAVQAPPAAAKTEAAGSASPVSRPVGGSAAAPPGSAPTIQPLDADDIVAAQEKVMSRVYDAVLPSVVQIQVTQKAKQADSGLAPQEPRSPFGPEGFPQLPRIPEEFFRRGEGSGFVWDDQGRVVTNNHVIQEADSITVVFANGAEAEAKVLGADPDSDLAVLELLGFDEATKPVVLGDSASLRVGQMAIAIGNPFGQEFTMTTGIVSALGRIIRGGNSPFSIPEVIQTDAPMNPGNSGGPLLDRQGRVVGVATQIISRSGSSAGIGFAIPIDTAKQVIPALISDGRYEYAWLGISGAGLRREIVREMGLPQGTGGALVIEVAKDSPADRAGLRGSDRTVVIDGQTLALGGDTIVAINSSPVKGIDDLITYLVNRTRPGDTVTLELLRGQGQREKVGVTLGKRPSSGR
jgi:2-alkenal reductase